MARDPLDLGALARGVRHAWLVVNAAIPLPAEPVAGVVTELASPEQEHMMTLRETAFAAVLDDMRDLGYYAGPADLADLERGVLPSPREG
jgi:hypothetical protein